MASFYDDVVELSAAKRAEIAKVPRDDEEYRQELGIPEFFGEPGYTTQERNWIRPTLELNGHLGAASLGPAPKPLSPVRLTPKSPAASSLTKTLIRFLKLYRPMSNSTHHPVYAPQ